MSTGTRFWKISCLGGHAGLLLCGLLVVASCAAQAEPGTETATAETNSDRTDRDSATADEARGGEAPVVISDDDAQQEIRDPTSLSAKENRSMSSEAKPEASLVEQYFPLQVGLTWRYRVRVTNNDGKLLNEATVKRTVQGSKTIGSREYHRVVTERVDGARIPMPDQHYRVTDSGVMAAVERTNGKELIVFPSAPEKTKQWAGKALPSIVKMQAKASTGQKVQCGAKHYTSCIYVNMDMAVAGQGFLGPAKVPVQIERWFAPGVGMVRERRTAGGQIIDALLER